MTIRSYNLILEFEIEELTGNLSSVEPLSWLVFYSYTVGAR